VLVLRRAASSERGAVVVLVAVLILPLTLLMSFAIDTGNWWTHKRHLQTQVDAAALAAGQNFYECFTNQKATAYTDMQGIANNYATVKNAPTSGGNGSFTFLYNSKTFAVGGPPPDDTVPGDPCLNGSYMFDVKGTEANLPVLFGSIPGFSLVPAINAESRIQLYGAKIGLGGLPLAVPDAQPKQVTATFVNETTNVSLGVVTLTQGASANGVTTWSGNSPALTVPSGGANIGVRIGLGGPSAGTCFSTQQNTAVPYVCYDYESNATGLVLARGYATTVGGANHAPTLWAAWPSTSCTTSGSPFFSDLNGSSCAYNMQATVDWGSFGRSTDPSSVGATLTSTVACPSGSTLGPSSLTWSNGVWATAGAPFAVPADAGVCNVSFDWAQTSGTITGIGACTNKAGNKCKGTFTNVQQIYSAVEDNGTNSSGPIKSLSLSESGGGTGAPYALAPGSHTLGVTVGIQSLGTIPVPTGPMLLHIGGGGHKSYAIACGGQSGSNYRSEFVTGCPPPGYQLNLTDVCPDIGNAPNPADCIPTLSGNKVGPTRQGMNDRLGSCPANHWATQDWPVNDPRIVQLYITDLAYTVTDGTLLPVVSFGAFYITGWDGASCSNNEAWPFSPEPQGNGDIWGHFIKYVFPGDTGGPGPCGPTGVNPCIPELTR
jgi:Putative Flp pilus-assembly TadE/G-like